MARRFNARTIEVSPARARPRVVEIEARRSCRDEITRLAVGVALILVGFAVGTMLSFIDKLRS